MSLFVLNCAEQVKSKPNQPMNIEELITFNLMIDTMAVNVSLRIGTLSLRNKPPIIYHQVTAERAYSSINVQIRVENPVTSQMVIMARYAKMPIVKKCSFVKIVSEIMDDQGQAKTDGYYYDWHITSDQVKNRTGDWYFGVASIG